MKILFLNPPWLEKGREGIRAGSRWPHTAKKLTLESTIPFPFFLAYAAAVLRENGFEVTMIDGVAARISLEEFFDQIKINAPDLIVFETSTPSYKYDLRITQRIKDKFKNVKLAFCGTHATVFPREILLDNLHIDYVLVGEYEYTLLELAQKLDKKEHLSDIKGLALKIEGRIRINERRPLINLDQLPSPARDLTSIYQYNEAFCKYKPNVQLHASRGCVYRCSFCAWPRIMYGGARYRIMSPEKVADEIEFLLRNYNFKEFYFDDDTFNVNKKYVEAICEEIERRKLEIAWSCMGHTGNMTKELLERMYATGCEAIKFGVETGNKDILKSLHKETTLEQIKDTFKWCRKIGIRTHATFTFGLPGETKKTIRESINFLLKLDPDSMQISLTTPLPGTLLYEEAKERGWLLTEEWSNYDGSCSAVMRTDNLSKKELEKAYRLALEQWKWYQFEKNIRDHKWEYCKKSLINPLRAAAIFCRWLKGKIFGALC